MALLVVGAAGGLAAVLLHQRGWGLAARAGGGAACDARAAARLVVAVAFMLGWIGAVAWAVVPRAEGDYLIPANASGYGLLVRLVRGPPGRAGDQRTGRAGRATIPGIRPSPT